MCIHSTLSTDPVRFFFLFGFLPRISGNITDYLLTGLSGFISTEGVSQTQGVKSPKAPTAVGDLEEEP